MGSAGTLRLGQGWGLDRHKVPLKVVRNRPADRILYPAVLGAQPRQCLWQPWGRADTDPPSVLYFTVLRRPVVLAPLQAPVILVCEDLRR